MTAILHKSGSSPSWSSMPGWNVVADLTPPELVNARGLARLRRQLAVGLVAIVAVCAAGYVYTSFDESSASDALDRSNARTSELQAEGAKYGEVTRVQASIDQFKTQVAGLMGNDAEVAALARSVRAVLPNTMALKSVNTTITGLPVAGTPVTPSLDTSGRAIIGTMSMTGTSISLDDLARFVTALSRVKGITNIVPSTNTKGQTRALNVSWNVTLQLTDAALTRRYTQSTDGGS